MKINKLTCQKIRQEAQAALDAIAKKHGVALPIGNITFSPDTIRFSVKGISIGNSGAAPTKDAIMEADFNSNFSHLAKKIGDTFISGNQQFTIVGSKSRNRKYPIIAKGVNGTQYKFPTSAIA